MTISTKTVRILYAISLLVWAGEHFVLHEFIPGEPPPWPAGLPGEMPFLYLTGIILFAAGIAVITNKMARTSVTIVGFMILLWSGLRNSYAWLTGMDFFHPANPNNAAYHPANALIMGFGALLVASTYPAAAGPGTAGQKIEQLTNTLGEFSVYIVGLFLITSGTEHFMFGDLVATMVPGWIPEPLFWAYFAGAALIAAGAGLITGIKRTLAAQLAAWMVFTWVLILHIPKSIGPERNAGEFTQVFEALAMGVFLFIIYNREAAATKR